MQEANMIIENEEIEPMKGPDIPVLPCIFLDDCENMDWDCELSCPDYLWREPKWQ